MRRRAFLFGLIILVAVLVVVRVLASGEMSAMLFGKDPQHKPAIPADVPPPSVGPGFSANPYSLNGNPNPARGTSILTDVRIATQPDGTDRIVFEFRDSLPASEIEYMDRAVQCASGARVPLPSSAVLTVGFFPAAAHDDLGRVTVKPTELSGTGRTILAARQICDFEGEMAWALAINGKQPFRVTTLTNPTRVIIDVKQ